MKASDIKEANSLIGALATFEQKLASPNKVEVIVRLSGFHDDYFKSGEVFEEMSRSYERYLRRRIAALRRRAAQIDLHLGEAK